MTNAIPLARPSTKLIFVGFGRLAGKTTSISLGSVASEGRKADGTLKMVSITSLTIQPGQRFVLVSVPPREGINPATGTEYNDAPYRLALEVPGDFAIENLGELIPQYSDDDNDESGEVAAAAAGVA